MVLRILLTSLIAAVACCSAAYAEAGVTSETIPVSQCTGNSTGPDGTYRQSFDAVDVVGAVAAIPPRTIADIDPGETGQICVGFQNQTGETIDLSLSTFNVSVDSDGAPLSTEDTSDYGASEWLALPTERIASLPHGDIAWVVVDVDVPTDAAAGSWYASVRATQRPSGSEQDDDAGGLNVTQQRSVISQLFIDIPGERTTGGRVVDPKVPRVIWWDGLDVARLPVLDDLRGLGVGSVRFGWQNTGTVTDEIDGVVRITSSLGGREVAKLPLTEGVVLRGATRDFGATWSEDIPLVGRFVPTVELTDSAGETYKAELDPIWVIPSWWYLLALVLAIGLPLWIRRRSKRRYRELLERVEAAEQRSYVEIDGDEDSWLDD
jgi:hypothetical protein